MRISRRGWTTGLASAVVALTVGCEAQPIGPPSNAVKVDVPAAQAVVDSDVVGRVVAKIKPKTGQIELYQLHEGNLIYPDEVATALTFEYGGHITCAEDGTCNAAMSLSTDQDKVTYIYDNGNGTSTCWSNGLPCGSGTNAPIPPMGDPCATVGTWCGPLQVTSSLSVPLQNVIVQISQPQPCGTPGALNCVKGCVDTAGTFGLCGTTEPTKVDSPANTSLTSPIQPVAGTPNAKGCSFCYGNKSKAETASLPGLRHVLLPNVGTAGANIYTDTVAMPLATSESFYVTFDVRYGSPSYAKAFQTPNVQLIQRNNAGTVSSCVQPTSNASPGSVEVNGGSFGPPSPCTSYTAGALPASCPLSTSTGVALPSGYSIVLPTTQGSVTVPTANILRFSDQQIQFRVTNPASGTYTGRVTVITPQGTKTTEQAFTVCPTSQCGDTVKNGNETAVDCGGGTCSKCLNGLSCLVNSDCQSGWCTGTAPNLTCQGTPSCTDGFQNGTETGVDCGGSCSTKCALGVACTQNSDCASNNCPAIVGGTRVCRTSGCADGAREGYTDSATYPSIAACAGGFSVQGMATARSSSAACVNGTGDDGNTTALQNGTGCPAQNMCQAGWGICRTKEEVSAFGGGACQVGTNGFWATLEFGDNTANCSVAGNSDNVFGCGSGGGSGSSGPTCGVLNRYTNTCGQLNSAWTCGNTAAEATNMTKVNGSGGVLCCNGCGNGAQDNGESDVDCGGPCSACSIGQNCGVNSDCSSGLCVSGKCVATCTDGIKNQDETDIDCGGSCGSNCLGGNTCSANGDCLSQTCTTGICRDTGCSDGVREGFRNIQLYPNVAGCSGGWSLTGLLRADSCSNAAGDDSANQNGNNCAAADLCATGWHICSSASDFLSDAGSAGCDDALYAQPEAQLFFASAQSSEGNGVCVATGNNDFWGCGNYGDNSGQYFCSPFNRFVNNLCGNLRSVSTLWFCGNDGFAERTNVTKAGPAFGGVLCCKD